MFMSHARIMLNFKASYLAKSRFDLFTTSFQVSTQAIRFRLLNSHKNPQIFSDSSRKSLQPLEMDEKFSSLLKHFKYGVPWSNTLVYSLMANKIAGAGGSYKGLENHLDIVNYYKQMDLYFDNVRREGLQIPKAESYLGLLTGRFAMDGVTIEILDDGEPVFAGRGTHRLAMSCAAERPWTPAFLVGISRNSLITKNWSRHLRVDRP